MINLALLAEEVVAVVMSDLDGRSGILDGLEDDMKAEISVELNAEVLAVLEKVFHD